MTSTSVTVNEAFEEEDEHHENGKTKVHSYHAGDGPAHLNTETHVKNGANHYDNRETSKSTSFFSRITKDTLFRVFLLLLILALLIPILVLVALIYKQMGTSYMAADSVGTNRMTGSLSGNPDSPNSLAGEEVVAPNGKNTEEVYKKEPWRRDPTGAWKLLGTTLTDSIDPRGDACIDFYGYSCDQWRDRHPLDGRQEISDQTLASEVVKGVILDTFNNMKPDDSSWSASVRWAKRFYDQCTSADETEIADRKKSVIDFLSNTFPTASASNHASLKRHVRSAAESNASLEAGHHDVEVFNTTLSNLTEVGAPNVIATSPVTIADTTPVTNGTTVAITVPPVDETSTTPAVEHLHNVTVIDTMFDNTTLPDENVTTVGVPVTPHIVTQAPVNTENIWSLASALSAAGVVSFFDLDYSKNPKDASDLKTVLRPPTLSLPSRRYYLKSYLSSKNYPLLEKSIVDTVKRLKSVPGSDSALFSGDQRTARDIIQFEEALARASPTTSPTSQKDFDFDFDKLQTRVPGSRIYSLSNLRNRWPRINWDAFLPDEAKKSANRSDSGANETASFIVADPAYIDQLVGLLEDYNLQTAINFLKWRYIFAVSDYLRTDDTLNTTCYKALERNMPLALAHVVYRNDYGLTRDEKSKAIYTPESIQLLFNRTVRAFKSILDYSGQVENASKKAIGDDLSNQIVTTQWPDIVKDGNMLDAIYAKTVQIAPENSSFVDLMNALQSSDFLDDKANAWSKIVPDGFVSTQYVDGNAIAMVYCPRILNWQFSQPPIGQFATVGWQLARELAKSVRYSNKAPLQNSRVDQCLVNQYNQFCYPSPINSCVDGAWTLEENFADSVALQVSFKAYKTWESLAAASGDTNAFPAFLAASNLGKFTMDQIFLLAYGSSFCNNAENQYISDWMASQRTSPGDDRVRGSVQNLNDFQLAFHCKAGDKMYRNTKERCQL